MQVAILTNFKDYLKSFSPLLIVSEQIKMFANYNYNIKVLVTDGFNPPVDSSFLYKNVTLCYMPDCSRAGENSKDNPIFDEEVANLVKSLEEHLEDIDVCITHDLLYLPDYTQYHIAARKAASEKLKNLRWLHWIHSSTSADQLIKERNIFGDKYRRLIGYPFPNSFLVYPNSYDIPRIAKSFGFEEKNVKCVPHSFNFCDYNNFHEMTKKLIKDKNMLETDIICVYPLRMDRGKQPHINMEIMAEVKRMGYLVRCIFVDFHSTGGDKVVYREEIKEKAIELGLSADDLIFTSEFDVSLNLEAPQQMVRDLFTLSNIFILPSRSETYSLIAQEAMALGNFVILNHDFPAMRSIYLHYPIYEKFGSEIDITVDVKDSGAAKTNTTHHPTNQDYYKDIAGRIIYEVNNNRVLAGQQYIRQKRNSDYVFKNYIQPLLYFKEEK